MKTLKNIFDSEICPAVISLLTIAFSGGIIGFGISDKYRENDLERALKEERAKVIGIYDKRENIENIACPKDLCEKK